MEITNIIVVLIIYTALDTSPPYPKAFWLDMFLKRRESLLINNFCGDMATTPGSQLVCATNLIVSFARFHRSLKSLRSRPFDLNPSRIIIQSFKNRVLLPCLTLSI
uniref:Uncharacterized protein n=1 Tax=Eptatretus burgeri TaxID=7764 RepID=A0A8C4N5U9_EPTBU